MAIYICDVCRDKLSIEQNENQVFQRVSSLESSFTCSECSKLFGMAFEVANRDEKQCDTSTKRKNLLRIYSPEIANGRTHHCYVTSNFDVTDPNFTYVSEINSSAVESQILPSDECVGYSATYNVQKNKADEKASSYVCKLSKLMKSSYTFKEYDEKDPSENQHANNISQLTDEISQIYTSTPIVKNGARINNDLQTNLNSSRYETCNDNIGYKSCFNEPNFKDHDKRSLECNICHVTLKTVGTLKPHMRQHDETNPFICNVFKKSCTTRNNLLQHMVKQSDKQSYKCNSCSSIFKTKAQLSQHTRPHSEKRPFKCYICSSTFKFRNNLYKHVVRHTDKRPFKCNICSSTYKLKSCLKQHKVKHLDKRPFKCNICPSTFKRKAHLFQHMLTHSEERTYECHICSSSFKYQIRLNCHILEHRNMT